jgi:LysM repeat protein
MVKSGFILGGILIMMLITSGCISETAPVLEATLTIAPPANPYQADPKTPNPTSTKAVVATEAPNLPSPTPFRHVIQPGDTLYGLALQYNITLDKLISANPGLDSSLLSIGTKVIIPFEDSASFGVPTPTPYPVPISDPQCLPTNERGLWCFVSIENNQNVTLENISASLNLYDGEENLVESFRAIPPLDYYFPGQNMPIVVFIPPPIPRNYQISAALLTAFQSAQTKPLTEIREQKVILDDQQVIAHIEGKIEVNEPISEESQVWVAAIAYHQGETVGIRKWISPEKLQPNQVVTFELYLYSLGPKIDEVVVYSELH